MLTFVSIWTFLLAPHAATPPPAPPPIHAVAVVAPAPAQIPPEATTTTTTSPPPTTTTTVPALTQPPAETDLTGLVGGQCAIAWNSVQVNPVSGQSGVVTSIYRGDCGEAQSIAGQYPGSTVVTVPEVSVDPGCSAEGDCTSPTMGG